MQPQTFPLGAALLLLGLLARSFFYRWWEQEKARRLGCKPVNQYPHSLPWGIDLFRDRLAAVREGRYNNLYLDHFDKYGATFEEHTLGKRTINTTETVNFQTVGALKFNDYGKPPSTTKALDPFLGRGVLRDDGPAWRHARDLVMPLFKRAELGDVDGFKKFVDRMMALIPQNGTTVDLQPLLQKLFLDSSTEFIFGESIDSLRDTSPYSQEFLDAFNAATTGAGRRAYLARGSLGFLFLFDRKWGEQIGKVHAFVDRHVAQALADVDSSNTKIATAERQRQRYVLIHGMAREIRDPVALRFQLLNIFLPARETTAIAVSNTIFFLARKPSLWRQLRADALALADKPLTFEVLKSLSSFRYTLFEGIRMQGPSGMIPRVALCDTVLPRGGGPDGTAPLFVPKGTQVALNNFPKYRDKELWGEDVETFRPSRFEGKLFGWEFTPFFGGQRICPAQQQVITQGVYLLVRLVTAFEKIENRDESWEYVERIKTMCESRNGVKVALYPPK